MAKIGRSEFLKRRQQQIDSGIINPSTNAPSYAPPSNPLIPGSQIEDQLGGNIPGVEPNFGANVPFNNQSRASPEDLLQQSLLPQQSTPPPNNFTPLSNNVNLSVEQSRASQFQNNLPFEERLLNLGNEAAQGLGLPDPNQNNPNAVFDEYGNVIGFKDTGQGIPPGLALGGVGLAEGALAASARQAQLVFAKVEAQFIDDFTRLFNQKLLPAPSGGRIFIGSKFKVPEIKEIYKIKPEVFTPSSGNVEQNTKTARIVNNYIYNEYTKSGRPISKFGKFIIAGIGFNGLGEWARLDNVGTGVEITYNKVLQRGSVEEIEAAKKVRDDIYNEPLWSAIGRFLPFVGGVTGFIQGYKALKFQISVNDMITEDIINGIPLTEETTAKKESDLFKEDTLWFHEEQEKARERERQAEIEGRNEDAAFWRKERQKKIEDERRARIESAEFWLAYRKKVAEMESDNSPSKLAFGLL